MLNGTSSCGRMHATHWFLPWILSTFTTTFAWRNSEISRCWSFRAELCASGVLDDPGLLGYFRHTWSAHTKISRRWEFAPLRFFVIFFGGKMRFTCCSCLGETHLQPHGQQAHSTWLPNSTHNQPLHVWSLQRGTMNNERPRQLD